MSTAYRTERRKGARQVVEPDDWFEQEKKYRFWMTVFLTVSFAIAALYVVLSDSYSQAGQKFAAGILGTLVGYWFRKA